MTSYGYGFGEKRFWVTSYGSCVMSFGIGFGRNGLHLGDIIRLLCDPIWHGV